MIMIDFACALTLYGREGIMNTRGVSQPSNEILIRELLLALNKTLNSERPLGRDRWAGFVSALLLYGENCMESIKFYEIQAAYIDYLAPYAQHLFRNRQEGQANERKYIGVVLQVEGHDYFAPLSSFKPKHQHMKEGLDFIKIRRYAVINLNNMFPVPPGVRSYVDFSSVKDSRYQSLLLAEYRFVKSIQDKIRKNAAALYRHKLANGNSTPLAKRCNDFVLLESVCANYML